MNFEFIEKYFGGHFIREDLLGYRGQSILGGIHICQCVCSTYMLTWFHLKSIVVVSRYDILVSEFSW